jgi:hypothetical protein
MAEGEIIKETEDRLFATKRIMQQTRQRLQESMTRLRASSNVVRSDIEV